MSFSLEQFSPESAALVQSCLQHKLSLTRGKQANAQDARLLKEYRAEQLFPDGRNARAAVSGLLLRFGRWDEAHEAAQEDESKEGSYWHAIAHRTEPDIFNSNYWFHRVGQHAIFSILHERTAALLSEGDGTGWKLKTSWDPEMFNTWCDQARQEPGSIRESVALAIQDVEWKLLFRWCALRSNP